jgi:hypothetical protein
MEEPLHPTMDPILPIDCLHIQRIAENITADDCLPALIEILIQLGSVGRMKGIMRDLEHPLFFIIR